MKLFNFLAVIILGLIIFSCRKTNDLNADSINVQFLKTSIDSVSYIHVSLTSGISFPGGKILNQHGHCWSVQTNPTLKDTHSSLGQMSQPGSFTSSIDNLSSGTKFNVRPFIIYQADTLYGTQIEFTTLKPGKPYVITLDVLDITHTSAVSGGVVLNDGGMKVTARGVCWSETVNFSIDTCLGKTINGSGTGSFSGELTPLKDGETYYVMSYATNAQGTGYGIIKTFRASPMFVPSVTLSDVADIRLYSAVCGGSVTSDGSGTVIARGVCWDTTAHPTLQNSISHTTDGTGSGTFTSNISGLIMGTTYYVSAYATNEKGTAYSAEIKQFSTKNCGNTIQYGGESYGTVLLGTQCWMNKNLNIGRLIAFGLDQTNSGVIEKYCYNNSEGYCTIYGGLYQWDEVMQFVTTEGARGICPDGWHIPSDAEWRLLTDYLGGESVAGGKLKETGLAHWCDPNTGATNSSGFTARGAGYMDRYQGFGEIKCNGYFWSSTQNDTSFAWERSVYHQVVDISRFVAVKIDGFSVRCIQNQSERDLAKQFNK